MMIATTTIIVKPNSIDLNGSLKFYRGNRVHASFSHSSRLAREILGCGVETRRKKERNRVRSFLYLI